MASDIIKKIKKKDINMLELFKNIFEYDLKYKNGNMFNRLINDNNYKNKIFKMILKSKCQWFNKKEEILSKEIPFHCINDEVKCNKNFFGDIIHYKSEITDFNKFKIIKKLININEEKEKLKSNLILDIQKLQTNKADSSTIKSKITKATKKIENYGNVIKTYTCEIFPDEDQIKIIHKWFNECDNVYNTCIKINEQKRNKNEYFNLDYKKSKLEIFNYLYKKKNKPAPYDILTDEVRSYCSNLKSCMTNFNNGHIKFFNLKPKNRSNGRSILIPHKSIHKDGFFSTFFINPIKGFDKINIELLVNDCRLVFDKYLNKYFMKCPHYENPKEILDRKETVALDPGEKIFMTYYSFNDCGMIGVDIRIKILNYQKKIKKLQSIIDKNKNNKNNKIKNKGKLKKYIKKNYLKIRNLVKELHNKTALYLVKNYKQVLLPEFKTSEMLSKRKIKTSVNIIKYLPLENQKDKFRKLTKSVKLSKNVKFVLNMLSHYKFKQHLLSKGKEYGCDIKIVTEEYTSQCCSRCGNLSNYYVNRLKKCSNCKLEINRDINGSRNILIKNWRDNYK